MDRSTSRDITMEITCEGCKKSCSLRLFSPFRWSWNTNNPAHLYSTQGDAIKAKMEQFKACPRMPTDIRLTNLTKEAPEKQKPTKTIHLL